jgi:hypothetical protein
MIDPPKKSPFVVTEKAMRPASDLPRCFYCHQPIGDFHLETCGLVCKKVVVRLTIEYPVKVPASWDAHMVEFHRNDGTWCANNLVDELEALTEELGESRCLCSAAHYDYVDDMTEAYLSE